MHWRSQTEPMPRRPNASNPQNFRAGPLHRKILDRAFVEFGDTGAALPAERGPHVAAVESCGQPVIRPLPITRKQCAMLGDHLMRLETRNAKTPGQTFCFDAVLNSQQAGLVAVAQPLVSLFGCVAWRSPDTLDERQIGITALVKVEHDR